jgi:hypothetical protein
MPSELASASDAALAAGAKPAVAPLRMAAMAYDSGEFEFMLDPLRCAALCHLVHAAPISPLFSVVLKNCNSSYIWCPHVNYDI